MKRFLPYAAASVLLSSCSIMGPAFTGLLSDPAPVGVSTPVGVSSQAGRRYTPAEDPATGLYGYINDLGMWTIPPRFESVQSFGSHGMARVRLGGRYGAIDPSGQFVIPAVFSSSSDASAAMQSIVKGRMTGLELWAQEDSATGLYGYLDHYGRWAIAPQFRRASAFNRNLAVVQVSDGRWGAIDLRGAMVVQPRFNSSSDARVAVQRLNR
ncbi:MAG TPA: WG repeat-containing protein [Candidatus Alistipes intestinigallinarum]|uniref:WG repeat-containing protein n=1 Tax=Candidatus Alistipes intestinigallinarum TaxID=2838440 RepID=A0A9D1YZ64_9BACT|nr:WG repeat-containing protein [Candidatus Alistipes intestinigallinarum]